jgi:amino acid adenylation domain-containing protein
MGERLEYLISTQARNRPTATAVVDGQGNLSYESLDSRSNQLANALISHDLRTDDRVCLMMPKSVDAVLTIVGTLKSGGVYIPLDVTSPATRLCRIIRALQPCWLIAYPTLAHLVAQCLSELEPTSTLRICWLGQIPDGFDDRTVFSQEAIEEASSAAPSISVSCHGLAYILFTSGSTGEPKGVPITHEDVAHFIAWANTYFGLGSEDRISGHSPLHFDMSVWDLFGALTSGAELRLVPTEVNLLPNLTADFIRESRLTQWFSVPSILTAMATRDVVAYNDFPDMRRLIWAGEVFPTSAVQYWMKRLPHVEFTNLYGPTEATIASTYYAVKTVPIDASVPIPIGNAIPGKRLTVLAPDQTPVGLDEVGDIYIGGMGLSPGYWRDPEKTTKAFCELPNEPGNRWYRTGDRARMDPQGLFHFHGRADRQIKSRGYRIELDDVENALSRLSCFLESAVVAIPTERFEGMRICAAYILHPDMKRTPAQLRADLAMILPSYMLPARWLSFDTLPRNQNGKIDYNALEHLFLDRERAHV